MAVGLAAALGYVSCRLGTVRIRAVIGVVEPPRRETPCLCRRIDDLMAHPGVEPPRLSVVTMDQPNALALVAVRSFSPRRSRRTSNGGSTPPTGRAWLTGRPLAMVHTLERIDRASTGGGPPSTLAVRGGGRVRVTDLLVSHPPIAERVDGL